MHCPESVCWPAATAHHRGVLEDLAGGWNTGQGSPTSPRLALQGPSGWQGCSWQRGGLGLTIRSSGGPTAGRQARAAPQVIVAPRGPAVPPLAPA